MPIRARALALALSLIASLFIGAVPLAGSTAAAGEKVVVIVGPVGSLTDTYRSMADRVASAASAAGASVVKVYSPSATWANARAAVSGANVIVYFGHGNGYPNPYTIGTEYTDRVNGWGLNIRNDDGDGDTINADMVYCGEKALLGTLTSSDGSAQWSYCGGRSNTDGISPAPGFTMVYAQAHYAPGFGERYSEDDPHPTLTEGQQRVRNYSYPVLALGAAGYLATAYGDADDIVTRLLTRPNDAYADIFRLGEGYDPGALKTMAHPEVGRAEVWVQKTVAGSLHFGDPDYWYAFAGNPASTPGGGVVAYPFSDIAGSKFRDDVIWLDQQAITSGCGEGRFCPDGLVTRAQMATFIARALNLPAATRDHFGDDAGSTHEDRINRLAEAGITSGCGEGRFCPDGLVARDQMASFLARARELAASSTDFFADDDGNRHEPNINAFAAADITRGCGEARFCPSGGVTRGQMAAFLHRAFGDD